MRSINPRFTYLLTYPAECDQLQINMQVKHKTEVVLFKLNVTTKESFEM